MKTGGVMFHKQIFLSPKTALFTPELHPDDLWLSPPGHFSGGTDISCLRQRVDVLLALEWLR